MTAAQVGQVFEVFGEMSALSLEKCVWVQRMFIEIDNSCLNIVAS